MASHLDLEEQEQLDQLKAFWARYGNLIAWLLIVVLAAYAGWNGWNYWQRDQGVKAGSMYDELEKSAAAGDAARAAQVFNDMKSRYAGTSYTAQGGLLAAKVAFEKGQLDLARANLAWVAENASETEYRTVAKLRLAGILLDDRKFDDALKALDGHTSPEFVALVDDRRGDIYQAAGKLPEAKAAYLKAWTAMDPKITYRRLIEAKLGVLGAAPPASAASGVEKSR